MRRNVMWRRDSEDVPILKDIVSSANRDAIVLQARGKELKGSNACTQCLDELGPFACCVVDDLVSPRRRTGIFADDVLCTL